MRSTDSPKEISSVLESKNETHREDTEQCGHKRIANCAFLTVMTLQIQLDASVGCGAIMKALYSFKILEIVCRRICLVQIVLKI